jgi:hypothetical protein
MVPISKADEYLKLMQTIAVPDYGRRAEIAVHGVCTDPKET